MLGEQMRLSQLIGRRYKERPGDALLESHALMLRGGYIRQVSNGIYSLLPPATRVVKNIEKILREEMNRIGGQEVLMPVCLPADLWKESERYFQVGSELLRFTDRTSHDMILGMTHEEAAVHLTRHEAPGYKQYPFMIYQVQTKYRDEPRSRGGLIRVREFTMKDAYSFHTTSEDLERYYSTVALAYARIFARVGLPEVVAVASDPGMMGGKIAHEYILLTEMGEDTIVTCDACGYLANREVAIGRIETFPEEPLVLEEVATPNCKTITEVAEFIGVPESSCCKAVFYQSDANGNLVLVLIRGDLEVNEAKLSKLLKIEPFFAEPEKIISAGAVPGFASTINISPKVRVIADTSMRGSSNLIAGANKKNCHVKNFNLERDAPTAEIADIASIRTGDGCPQCSGKIVLRRGIEAGNIFQLGDRYTSAMKMRYLDENSSEKSPLMGCYGIGVGRLAACIAEKRHDSHGIIWPISIAPWKVHICALKISDPMVRATAEKLYDTLNCAGIETLLDDRGESTGAQFADADLLGAPLRLTISQRNIKENKIEWKERSNTNSNILPFEHVLSFTKKWISQEISKIEAVANKLKTGI